MNSIRRISEQFNKLQFGQLSREGKAGQLHGIRPNVCNGTTGASGTGNTGGSDVKGMGTVYWLFLSMGFWPEFQRNSKGEEEPRFRSTNLFLFSAFIALCALGIMTSGLDLILNHATASIVRIVNVSRIASDIVLVVTCALLLKRWTKLYFLFKSLAKFMSDATKYSEVASIKSLKSSRTVLLVVGGNVLFWFFFNLQHMWRAMASNDLTPNSTHPLYIRNYIVPLVHLYSPLKDNYILTTIILIVLSCFKLLACGMKLLFISLCYLFASKLDSVRKYAKKVFLKRLPMDRDPENTLLNLYLNLHELNVRGDEIFSDILFLWYADFCFVLISNLQKLMSDVSNDLYTLTINCEPILGEILIFTIMTYAADFHRLSVRLAQVLHYTADEIPLTDSMGHRESQLFISHVKTRHIQFTAWKSFKIRKGLLMSIFGLVLTNGVLLQEFMNKTRGKEGDLMLNSTCNPILSARQNESDSDPSSHLNAYLQNVKSDVSSLNITNLLNASTSLLRAARDQSV